VTAISHASSLSLKRKEKEKEIQKKRNIKSKKIDKRKREMLVSKAFHNISGPNSNPKRTKVHIFNTSSSIKPNKLNNFLFQCCLYFHTNIMQFDMDITKINFAMTYLSRII